MLESGVRPVLATGLSAEPKLSDLAPAFSAAVDALERSIAYVVENYGTDIRAVSVGAVPMLKLFGNRGRRLAIAAIGLDRTAAFGRHERRAAMPPSMRRRC